MLKIKNGARAWQFSGGMFNAVDIIRALGVDESDRLAPTFSFNTGVLSVYCPVADKWKTASVGDWIVKTEGSRILIYGADSFIFAFNEPNGAFNEHMPGQLADIYKVANDLLTKARIDELTPGDMADELHQGMMEIMQLSA